MDLVGEFSPASTEVSGSKTTRNPRSANNDLMRSRPRLKRRNALEVEPGPRIGCTFGFGLTFYPTVAVYIWYVLFIGFGLRIPLF